MSAHSLPLSDGCPVCGNSHVETVLECSGIPVHCNVLSRTLDEALAVERGELRLSYCPVCSMVYNAAFNPDRISYSPRYENSLHYSPRFSRYLSTLADSLVDRHGLQGREVAEIGCGDGHFLSLICAAGGNRGIGFDRAAPSLLPDDSSVEVTLVPENFGESSHERSADFICCRHVLEHISQPRRFLQRVLDGLKDDRPSAVYFEVPSALHMLEKLAVWDLLYEHCLYFTAAAIEELFVRCGFEILSLDSRFDGQFLSVEARPASRVVPEHRNARRTNGDFRSLTAQFSHHYHDKIRQWNDRLHAFLDQGQTVAVWGAGTKGGMFLNSLKDGHRVQAAIDVNPRKSGCFVAGTGQQIFPPEQLPALDPDVVLIMNPAYEEEIRAELEKAGVECQVLVV